MYLDNSISNLISFTQSIFKSHVMLLLIYNALKWEKLLKKIFFLQKCEDQL